MKKISIATISFNSEKYIEQTILSIINQNYENIEYIIIDGGSTDNTLNIINRYKNHINVIISEHDSGISDAMNKAISIFSGDYLLFIHSDDFLLKNSSIKDAVQLIDADNSKNDIYAFSILFGSPELGFSQQKNSLPFTPLTLLKTNVKHQGALCSKESIKKIGLFNTQLKITMDYEWFLRAYKLNLRLKVLTKPIAFMRNSGISNQDLQARLLEEQIIHKESSYRVLRPLYWLWWKIYPIMKTL